MYMHLSVVFTSLVWGKPEQLSNDVRTFDSCGLLSTQVLTPKIASSLILHRKQIPLLLSSVHYANIQLYSLMITYVTPLTTNLSFVPSNFIYLIDPPFALRVIPIQSSGLLNNYRQQVNRICLCEV